MFTIFNRRELATTFSMKEQAMIRNLLSENDIDYMVKTVNMNSHSVRGHMGTLGENLDLMYEYIIYVKKSDYESALHIIR